MCCFGCYHKPCYDSKLRRTHKDQNYSYDGKKFKVNVVDVYDGDTLTAVFRYRGQLEQHVIRLIGYDSPEMKPPKDQTNREAEIRAAKEAKQALELLLSRTTLVTLKCGKFDKYGRILGTIIVPRTWFPCRRPIVVNDWMIEHGHGIPYDGGTKKQFSPK